MSGTGEPVSTLPPEPVSVNMPEPVIPVVEVDIPADGGFPAPEPEPALAPAEPAQPDGEPKVTEPATIKKSPYQARIDALVREREAAKAEAAAEKAQAELYKAMAEGKNVDADGNQIAAPAGLIPGSPEFVKAVKAEAANIAAADAAKAKTGRLLSDGHKDYKDFDERCTVVASLGAGDRPDFMQIVIDSDIIGNGAKVIALLADKPDEAARILALPTVQMTAALVKFEAENAKAAAPVLKPLSAAPAPIRTIDGISKGNDEPSEKDDMATYAAKYKAKLADKMKSGQPARFARH